MTSCRAIDAGYKKHREAGTKLRGSYFDVDSASELESGCASHQIREPPAFPLLSSSPSSTRSLSRPCTHRRERDTSSVISAVLIAGSSLSRMIPSNVSSLTVSGRPRVPIQGIHPRTGINQSGSSHARRQIQTITGLGYNYGNRPPRALLRAPARRSARGRLSTTRRGKAVRPNALPSLEFTGSIATEQTNLTNYGFVPASRLRHDDRDVDDAAARETEEGQR